MSPSVPFVHLGLHDDALRIRRSRGVPPRAVPLRDGGGHRQTFIYEPRRENRYLSVIVGESRKRRGFSRKETRSLGVLAQQASIRLANFKLPAAIISKRY